MTKLQRGKLWAEIAWLDFFARFNIGLSYYKSARRAPVMAFIRRTKGEVKMASSPVDAIQIFHAARATAKLPGCACEVGVFRGGTARVIMEALPDKRLHLCDTFEGLPDAQEGLDVAQFKGPLEAVKGYLNSDRIVYHKGYFPRDTAHEMASEQFCFVNLDMDYYDGTLAALEFFWPRMVKGGVIITHDYVTLVGPAKAFEEFFAERPEPVIELAGTQAMVMKT